MAGKVEGPEDTVARTWPGKWKDLRKQWPGHGQESGKPEDKVARTRPGQKPDMRAQFEGKGSAGRVQSVGGQ